MNRTLCTLAVVAAAALAGCEQETITARGPYDPQAGASANNADVVLPPSIAGSHVYRCKDNSLIYIDWYSDGSARVKASPNEAGTHVPAPPPPEANATATAPPPLEGSPSAATITYNGQSCKR